MDGEPSESNRSEGPLKGVDTGYPGDQAEHSQSAKVMRGSVDAHKYVCLKSKLVESSRAYKSFQCTIQANGEAKLTVTLHAALISASPVMKWQTVPLELH